MTFYIKGNDLNKANIQVISLRANHYFNPRKTHNKQGEPYKVFTSFYRKWRPYLMIRDEYDYHLEDISKGCSEIST